MEKRSDNKRSSKRVKVSDEKLKVNKTPETVRLMLLKDLKLNVIGKVTGKRYTFSGGGSQLDIDKRDAEIMIKKRSGACGGCPSSVGQTPYFENVE